MGALGWVAWLLTVGVGAFVLALLAAMERQVRGPSGVPYAETADEIMRQSQRRGRLALRLIEARAQRLERIERRTENGR